MIACGVAMIGAMILAGFLFYTKRLENARWLLNILVLLLPLPFIANTFGWIITEAGRQPWMVVGLQKVSDAVSQDALRKQMIEQAAPPGVKANVVPVKKMIEVAKDPRFGATKALLLFETPQDALRAIEGGVDIKELNIGSMAHSVGKVVVNKAIAMDQDDVETLEKLKEMGVTFDVRKVPADSKENMDSLLKKAKTELQNMK